MIPLTGETLRSRQANVSDGARLDLKAGGFWTGNRFEAAFFDVRVFNPHAASYRCQPVARVYNQHETQKRREYEERVREVEGGNFTPLVFSTTGGASRTTNIFLKRLGSLLSAKRDIPYSVLMGWLRCRIGFALLRSAILCLRGSRPHHRRVPTDSADQHPAAALAESRLQTV